MTSAFLFFVDRLGEKRKKKTRRSLQPRPTTDEKKHSPLSLCLFTSLERELRNDFFFSSPRDPCQKVKERNSFRAILERKGRKKNSTSKTSEKTTFNFHDPGTTFAREVFPRPARALAARRAPAVDGVQQAQICAGQDPEAAVKNSFVKKETFFFFPVCTNAFLREQKKTFLFIFP